MELVNDLGYGLIKNTFEFIEASKIRFSPRFFTYYPSHTISLETKNYELKTADSLSELIEVFKLRYDNFLENVDASAAYIFDIDKFDHVCDLVRRQSAG
jgi:putative hemolysin